MNKHSQEKNIETVNQAVYNSIESLFQTGINQVQMGKENNNSLKKKRIIVKYKKGTDKNKKTISNSR
jgi:hypothetical protein